MADSSFDVVSKVDKQEVDNAMNQASKEIGTRYDFRDTQASVERRGSPAVLRQTSVLVPPMSIETMLG